MTQQQPSVRTWRSGAPPWAGPGDGAVRPRTRVVVDNDFAGDPDDLFQLAHHLLSGVDVRGAIVSRLRPDDSWNRTSSSVAAGRAAVDRLTGTMGVQGLRVLGGDDRSFAEEPGPTEAATFLIEEAMRSDERPLVVAAGGGLGEVARALRAVPEVADRLTVLWIGGAEHPDLASPPTGAPALEYNLAIDVEAARYVFEETRVPIWQVPRDAYRRVLVSMATLRRGLAGAGPLGALLLDSIVQVRAGLLASGVHPGETYVLGDQPLVLLTALTTTFEPDAASSDFVLRPTPGITADGGYRPQEGARPMRVYHHVDVPLVLTDMFDSFAELATWQQEVRDV